MRTTLDIDDTLLESLLARHPAASKTLAIETAVRFYLSHDTVSRLRELAGALDIDDVSQDLRSQDRAT